MHLFFKSLWFGLLVAVVVNAVVAAVSLSTALAHYNDAPLTDAQLPAPAPLFGLPFEGSPGPGSWLLSQPYGNTTSAYQNRRAFYGNGQGIHFGVDLAAPCGTPVSAIGDGTVVEVDGPHGSAPHNLVIDHGNGLHSLYGHLLERPTLEVGQRVKRGDVVALSGDSQFTCHSAPHLHLEIRDASHKRLFNPVLYIDADWEALALVGDDGVDFTYDLSQPRRWQRLGEQPDAALDGALLNDYPQVWPPAR